MSWLRERAESGTPRTAEVEAGEPWRPAVLESVSDRVAERLTYVVVDERDEHSGGLTLTLSPWPRLDALGRVRHASGAADAVGVPAADWLALLTERRVPEVLRTRPPRVGDAFAMLLHRDGNVLEPVGPIVDVTSDARDAARVAFYGAVATPLDAEAAEQIKTPETDTVTRVDEPAEWAAHVRPRAKS